MSQRSTEQAAAAGVGTPDASPLDRLLTATTAGLAGSVLAVALTLPLRSPDDLIANAFTSAMVSVPGALALGVIWARLPRTTTLGRRTRLFATICAAFLVATVAAALAVEPLAELSGVASFAAPQAAAVLGAAAIGAPVLEHYAGDAILRALRYVVPVAAIVIVVAGWVLAVNEVGFNEPPSLSLPPPP